MDSTQCHEIFNSSISERERGRLGFFESVQDAQIHDMTTSAAPLSPPHVQCSCPSGLHVQHHYSVYQFSHNALPLMATAPCPFTSKARRPPGGSAVPLVECPPNMMPQVRGNIINPGPSPSDGGPRPQLTPVHLLFDGLPLCFSSNPSICTSASYN